MSTTDFEIEQRRLQTEIIAAHASGDAELLRGLQSEYRLLGVCISRQLGADGVWREVRGGGFPVTRTAATVGTCRFRDATMTVRKPVIHVPDTESQANQPAPKPLRTGFGPTIRRVVLTRHAKDELMRDQPFDGLERGGPVIGEIDGGTAWIEHLADATFEGRNTMHSVEYDPDRIAGLTEQYAEHGLLRLGTWHVHPNCYGRVANPSDQDLRAWIAGCELLKRNSYVAVIVQRAHEDDGDAGWLWPVYTGFVTHRDEDGLVDCDVLAVEHEDTEVI